MNTVSKLSIFGSAFFAAGVLWAWSRALRSPYATQVELAVEQPVPFSHKHHVAGLGLDCRHCHAAVEESDFAGLPATHTCMSCHSQVWSDAPMLAPVRESYRDDRSIEWVRVHDLPDFVYFSHRVHVAASIGCESCHGRVDRMPLTWREHTLQMEWCLECHRHPERHLRPRSAAFEIGYVPPEDQAQLGRRLIAERGIDLGLLTSCSECHR